MKQIAQYQDGRLELQEVPVPAAPPGGILVQTTHSVISPGTERMKVEQARMNLLQKARARPDQVRKVMDTARNLGWREALEKVRNRLGTPTPLGYSAAGIVVEVHPGNTRFRVGDRVACGGAECAFHAEYLAMPDLLAAKVPAPVENWQAAYANVLAIGLQVVRQMEPALGDRVVVMGQGLIGLLVTGLLRANGVRVMAVDVAEPRRALCEAMGAERVVIQGAQQLSDEVRQWTDGYGADAVALCTSTPDNTPLEQSADAIRDRGRIVVLGNTRVDLAWKVFYRKEIDVRYSRSSGPGRYDPTYEWSGTDYPVDYVRWTEQRNLDACLHLVAAGCIDLAAVTTRRAPLSDAPRIYADLVREGARDVGVVLEYPPASEARAARTAPPPVAVAGPAPEPARATPLSQRLSAPVTRLDVIGAGNFARTMLLPHLQGKIAFGTVANQTSLSAGHVKARFGFREATTNYAEVLMAAEGGAVLIATRHHLHAALVQDALEANRHVFVEKPLCLTRGELAAVDARVGRSLGSVMIGFNRRFAPASVELKRQLGAASGPKTATYRVMAGALDPQHWYANHAESGGRVLGEACHFLDYFCFLFDSRPVRVLAQPTWPAAGRLAFPDSIAAQVEFADGSCGQLVYTAEGDSRYPKETLTVFGAGLVAEIVNFRELRIWRGRRQTRRRYASKGHAEEMAAWVEFLQARREPPLPYGQGRQSMELTFAVLDSVAQARAVEVGGTS
ncbi:MAG: bi-domain-containing oxidoreductase [Verrucomicrobia bacterium]|nr:bi-domain-containing oxidoreductase [Verrucomicrobiota bacterium]